MLECSLTLIISTHRISSHVHFASKSLFSFSCRPINLFFALRSEFILFCIVHLSTVRSLSNLKRLVNFKKRFKNKEHSYWSCIYRTDLFSFTLSTFNSTRRVVQISLLSWIEKEERIICKPDPSMNVRCFCAFS